MERRDAFEDLGYGQPVVRRPTFDPGAFDYQAKFGRRMTAIQGLKTARSILRRQEIRARTADRRNSNGIVRSGDEAGIRRSASPDAAKRSA